MVLLLYKDLSICYQLIKKNIIKNKKYFKNISTKTLSEKQTLNILI